MEQVLRDQRARIVVSVLLVLVEAGGIVTSPLVIGVALDDHFAGSERGVILLAVVGLVTMAVATIRRLHDVRLYALIYERASEAAVDHDDDLSTRSARLTMLREVVDFLEYSLPELLMSLVTFVGVLAFLAGLSGHVFLAGLAVTCVIVTVHALTARRTIELNRRYHDEFERQVDVLRRNDRALTRRHVGRLDGWLIRLGDLDAVNVAVGLTLATGLQVFAIIAMARSGADPGTVFSVVLYVVEFAMVVPYLPAIWQEYLGLRDILRRLRGGTLSDPGRSGEARG